MLKLTMFSAKRLFNTRSASFRWALVVLGGVFLLDLASFLIAEGLWFQGVEHFQVFWLRVQTQGGLGIAAFIVSAGLLWGNLAIARQRVWPAELPESDRPQLPGQMGFIKLVCLTIVLSLMVGILVVYHGQIAASHWHPRLTLYNAYSRVPVKFHPESIWQVGRGLVEQPWQLGLVAGLMLAILVLPQFVLGAIALLMSLGFSLVISEHWAVILSFFKATPFNLVDPQFQRDIGFYIFKLPVWELLEFWLIGLFALAFVSVCLMYLLSGNSLSQGKFPGFSVSQQRHLYGLGGGLMLAVAFSYWLDRYELLYSRRGIAYGASYTDVFAELPMFWMLCVLGTLIGLYLIGRAVVWQGSRPQRSRSTRRNGSVMPARGADALRQNGSLILSNRWFEDTQLAYPSTVRRPPQNAQALAEALQGSGPNPKPLLWVLSLYVLLVAIAAGPLPLAVQRLVVQPNELERERSFVERTIALTREAFNLEPIDVETFDPQTDLTYTDILENDLTISNVRLWDTRPLLETNRQLQRIRLYYEFPDADIDRYILPTDTGGTARQQVLIAARELDYNSVPEEAKTWVNEHLIYTHGYGFTLSPVNTVGQGGLPDYFVRGIEHLVSSDRIRDTIPIGRPRIYYGELTDTYVMTQTQVSELDYPSGSDNVYNSYDGSGGVNIGSFLRRLIYSKHLRDWRMLLSEDFTSQTRLMYRRNINNRVRAIAPFLRYDSDPYLVVVDIGDGRPLSNRQDRPAPGNRTTPNYLYWVIDAYTTSDRFPYSDPSNNDFNYIRNSVKVVINAYNGKVDFYIADATDPIIQTWSKIFPDMFHSLDEMPLPLQEHIRYPQDFYRVQSDQLMTYHMTDPQVFYNREDQWRAPNEIYADEPTLVEPYYLIMKLPVGTSEEFILFRPFTPVQRNNLVAWLAARSDGDRYGRMLLYRFPKEDLTYGPEQIEARINQDPVISQQISLWNRRGSRAIQGNLLVIPIEDSLIYVEPIYLEAEQNRLPTLVRVIVAYENQIAMAETLQQALEAIFLGTGEREAPPIVRPFEGEEILPSGSDVLPLEGDTQLPAE